MRSGGFVPLILTALLVAAAPLSATKDEAAAVPVARGEFRGAMQTEYPGWFKQSFLEFHDDVAEAAAAGKRLAVLFHQDGCPYCNRLVEVNLAQPHIEELMRRHFDVVAVNMWGDRDVVTVDGKAFNEKTFAAALQVQFTPTMVFFDQRGKVALRLNGYQPPAEFMRALEYVATGRYEAMSYNAFLRANAPAPGSGGLHAQPFFMDPPYDLGTRGEGKPLAVFFEQHDCAGCDTLHTRILTDPATRRLIEQFDAIQLDMWSRTPVVTPRGQRSTARQWAGDLGVGYAPTIVLFDASGKEVIRSEALFKTFHIQSLFAYVLSGDFRHEPRFQRFLSERAERLRDAGVDVDIWD